MEQLSAFLIKLTKSLGSFPERNIESIGSDMVEP
jgi:hypothetical protein